MRNVAASTCEIRVSFPPAAPYPDNLDRWHARRAREIAASDAKEKNLPPKMTQEPRSPAETTQPSHQNSTHSPNTTPPIKDDPDDFLT
jgi:hypothetical protein